MKHWQLVHLDQLDLTISLDGVVAYFVFAHGMISVRFFKPNMSELSESHCFFGDGSQIIRYKCQKESLDYASACDQGLLRNREAEL